MIHTSINHLMSFALQLGAFFRSQILSHLTLNVHSPPASLLGGERFWRKCMVRSQGPTGNAMSTFFTALEVLERHRLHTSLSRRARRTSGTSFSVLGFRCVWYSYCPLRFSEIFFIDASTEATTVASLESIALSKGVGSTADDTLKWLQAQKSEWLLLFNNADDKTLNLRNFFPSCRHGSILITSRYAGFRDHAPDANQEVSGMTPSDAQNLLLYGIQEECDGVEVRKMADDIVSVCSIMVGQ